MHVCSYVGRHKKVCVHGVAVRGRDRCHPPLILRLTLSEWKRLDDQGAQRTAFLCLFGASIRCPSRQLSSLGFCGILSQLGKNLLDFFSAGKYYFNCMKVWYICVLCLCELCEESCVAFSLIKQN